MTSIEYSINKNTIELTASGHAGFDEIGKDIVCSAISILIQTLVAEMGNVADSYDFEMRGGYAWVKAEGDIVVHVLDTIITGFRLLEENYPEYIEVIRV